MEKPWKVILAFLGVFVAGAVFGGFFSLGIGRRIWEIEAPASTPAPAPVPAKTVASVLPPVQPAPPPAAKGAVPQVAAKGQLPVPLEVERAQLMHRVTNRLNLTPVQKAQITPIIQRAVQDIWRQQQNLYRETTFITQRMKQDIAKELTPEQQTHLDELWTKSLEQFRKRQAEAQAQVRQQGQAQPKAPASSAPAPTDKSASDDKAAALAPEKKDQSASSAKPAGKD